jgi:hypothetical protein
MSHGFCLTLLVIAIGVLPPAGAAGAEPVDYVRQVKPILQARCYGCHGVLKQKAGLRLDTAQAIRRGGDSGPALQSGQGGESLIVERVTAADPAERMPPEGAPLSAEQVALLRAWIDQGAGAPADERPPADPRRHWSFQPIVRPRVPALEGTSAVASPIDAFLEAERRRRGVAPLEAAPPHVLLRRVYLDLVGLPPTREELHDFLADPSDLAYLRVVDRLLASPQYGERWARHWMDVWRYSDWYGRRAVPDVLNSYAQIWRWRDWIVRSLNQDRGYDEMVRAMLAADEITPADDQELAALGFLVRNFYRWNYNVWMKDNVEHTGKAFLGLTFNCAHCHDHKYDPITQEDYFALRAVFEPLELRHDRVPGEPDPGPYPKYEYGKAYRPITSGMVRVFDEKLDAETYLYTGGESRNVIAGRPPVAPGVPEFLGGRSFRVEPVELPVPAYYPGMKGFVRQEEVAHREAAVARAEEALARSQPQASEATAGAAGPSERDVDQAQLAFAVADLEAVRARIAADVADPRYGGSGADFGTARRDAARAEQRAARARAELELLRADRAVVAAQGKAEAEAAKAERFQAAARKALDMARAAIDRDPVTYSPLSPLYPTRSTGRRRALACWITDRANPLAARVAANHVWRWHFGTPLVATTFDFGRNGAPPLHPELLDWLAAELIKPTAPGARPWSLKALHRQIVTSAAYRMRSHAAPAEAAGRTIDRENRLYWHFPTGRMEAELVRDSLLHLAGGLETRVGGPEIDLAEGLTSRRRSLYFSHHAEGRMPFLELFDAPDACDAYRRTTTVVPQQALALVNNDMLLDLSGALAVRLWEGTRGAASEDTRNDAFLVAAFEQVLARGPSPRERELTLSFLHTQAELLRRERTSQEGSTDLENDAGARARRDLVHAMFSHHDFVTIH